MEKPQAPLKRVDITAEKRYHLKIFNATNQTFTLSIKQNQPSATMAYYSELSQDVTHTLKPSKRIDILDYNRYQTVIIHNEDITASLLKAVLYPFSSTESYVFYVIIEPSRSWWSLLYSNLITITIVPWCSTRKSTYPPKQETYASEKAIRQCERTNDFVQITTKIS